MNRRASIGKFFKKITQKGILHTLFRNQNSHNGLFISGLANQSNTFDERMIIEETSKNPIAMRCIKLISENISRIPLETKLPNIQTNLSELIEIIVMNLLLFGNCFLEIQQNSRNEYIFVPLNTTNVQLFHNNDTIVEIQYEHNLKKIYKPVNSIIHIKNYNPFNLWYGYSITQSVFEHIKQYNYLCYYMVNLAKHGGMLSGVLSCKNNISSSTLEILQKQIDILYKKMSSTGTIMVLEGGEYEWKNIGLSPKDLEIAKNLNDSACAIARAYGVPMAMIGLHNTEYSAKNYKEIRNCFWQETINPFAAKVFDQLSNQISQKLRGNFFITPSKV